MTKRTKSDTYFEFLLDKVWIEPGDSIENELEFTLLETLYHTEFYSLVPNDDNRGEDGLDLRNEYDKIFDGSAMDPPFVSSSMLEMLIGLSKRLEFESLESRWEKRPNEWFWVLINNLGIDFREATDYSEYDYRERIVQTLDNLLARRYKSNGEGGLFPLKNPRNDQKRVEIWYQMSEYTLENYPI